MPIDHSIYRQNQGMDSNPGEAFGRGMRLGDLYRQRKEDEAVKNVFKSTTLKKADGTMDYDRPALLSELAKINPEKAMKMDEHFRQRDTDGFKFQAEKTRQDGELAEQKRKDVTFKLDLTTRAMGSMADQASYEQGLKYLAQNGLDVSEFPREYDKGLVDRYYGMSLTAKDRLAQQNAQRGFELEEKRIQSSALDRKEARDERRFQHGIKMDEKMQAFKTPYGLANSEGDAKKLKDAFEMKKSFDNKIDQMIALREKHNGGAVLNRDDVDRGKQLSQDLLLAYKDLAKLGVLSISDEKILRDIIPSDPLQYNSPFVAVTGQDPTLHRMKSFKSDSDKDFETRVGTRTRSGIDTVAHRGKAPRTEIAAKDQEAIQWAMQNPSHPKAAKILEVNGVTQVGGR